MEMGLSECLCMNVVSMNVSIVQKRKINAKRVAYGHQTFKKKKIIISSLVTRARSLESLMKGQNWFLKGQ
jgi:hypothetical protein